MEAVGFVELLAAPAAKRRWSDEAKGRIVAETLKLGASVNEVARRHALKANHLSAWRTLARKTVPVNGSLRSTDDTSAAKPSCPFRKSIAFVATMIRTRFDGKIMRQPSARGPPMLYRHDPRHRRCGRIPHLRKATHEELIRPLRRRVSTQPRPEAA